jgi:hypothetical protein
VGVPFQHFVEEPEALDRLLETRLPAGGIQGRCVDDRHVLAERVVDRPHCINRTGHDHPPLV